LIITMPIPSTGEALPVIGLRSWVAFNVGYDEVAHASCAEVMRDFFIAGGRLNSSPMYGSSQEVIGDGLKRLGKPSSVFSADKVWIAFGSCGKARIEASRRCWEVPRFDLLQIHNLLSWKEHIHTLLDMKAAGQVRYIEITTSEGRRHREFEQIMRFQRIDFVQVTYNILDREVELIILPLALERGMGVIINRPFRQGALIRKFEGYPLPPWAAEIDCANWAQLKFIVSHPAVTCAIPATTSDTHVLENMGAAYGRLPEERMRRRMIAHVEQL
jgi:diketogulonate reductase-like aldo/keto reductase